MDPESYQAYISREGELVIPTEARERLRIAEGGYVRIVVQGDSLRINRLPNPIQQAQELLRPYVIRPPMSDDEAEDLIATAIAEDVVRRSGL